MTSQLTGSKERFLLKLFLFFLPAREFALSNQDDEFGKFCSLFDIEGIENGTVMSIEDEGFCAHNTSSVPQEPQFVPMPGFAPIHTSSSGHSGGTLHCIDSDSSLSNVQPMANNLYFGAPQHPHQAMMTTARSSFVNLQAISSVVPMPLYPTFMGLPSIPPMMMATSPSSELLANLTPQERLRQEALFRYRQKRARKAINGGGVRKKVRYTLRKINADRRPRIKGRFIKKGEIVPGLECADISEERPSVSVDTDTEEEAGDEEEEDSS